MIVTVRHTFEAAHRLPHLDGKCQSLHGHSWGVELGVLGEPDENGVVVEFAALKRELRSWIDQHLDHATLLGKADPLLPLLHDYGKTFAFGSRYSPAQALAVDLPWPTVEAVAALIAALMTDYLRSCAPDARVGYVTVQETAVNSATWTP